MLQQTLDDPLPYDKQVFNKLIGYIQENDEVLINKQLVKASCCFNAYAVADMFSNECETYNLLPDSINSKDLVSWLVLNKYVMLVGTTSPQEIQTSLNYELYPFAPSYSSVKTTTRILQMQLDQYTVNDIFILSLYADTEHKGNVNEIVRSRETKAIKSLVTDLIQEHELLVKFHVAS